MLFPWINVVIDVNVIAFPLIIEMLQRKETKKLLLQLKCDLFRKLPIIMKNHVTNSTSRNSIRFDSSNVAVSQR